MRATRWRLVIGMVAAIVLALAAGQIVASAADSQPAGAFTFGAVLVAAWLAFMARTRLTIVSAEGHAFRFHPLYVAGISVVIAASALLLAELLVLSLLSFAVGLMLISSGRRRSGPVSPP
ncbi:MAG TPA: hypothetical protein VK919_05210 [Solirubrobacterales bacterium]|nr:hypothetical protein [Solirubrobacterales bacterium]